MAARDMYIFQIIKKYSDEKNGGIKEAYKEVCRHLEEVEATKRALEDAMRSKEEQEKPRNYYLERACQITDEMIQILEDAGYGVKSDDWRTNWEEMLEEVREWELRMKKRWEEEREKSNENN